MTYLGAGGGKGQGKFAKGSSDVKEDPAVVKRRLLSPSSKALTFKRSVMFSPPQVSVSGLQVLRKFHFLYISFLPLFPTSPLSLGFPSTTVKDFIGRS